MRGRWPRTATPAGLDDWPAFQLAHELEAGELFGSYRTKFIEAWHTLQASVMPHM
jgi:hypothetical protein